jgi:hypothetical protein
MVDDNGREITNEILHPTNALDLTRIQDDREVRLIAEIPRSARARGHDPILILDQKPERIWKRGRIDDPDLGAVGAQPR